MNKLTQQQKDIVMNQITLVKTNLIHCQKSGCDVHEVAQMQMMAECIIGLIKKDLDGEVIQTKASRLYNRHLDYFKRKFSR